MTAGYGHDCDDAGVIDAVTVRVMMPSEYAEMRGVAVEAFDGDDHIGVLIDELRASWCWDDDLSFVAVHDDAVVAQVLYTRALLDAPERLEPVLVLSPVGVRPDLQRRGIGTRLITESLDALTGRPEALVFLEGSPTLYPKLGFSPAVAAGFAPPSDRIPEPAFQFFSLHDSAARLTGRLVYPDPFWRTDSVGLRDDG